MNEILIYGDIGWEVTAKGVEEELRGFDGDPVRVRINSGGGDVYEGIAILNALRAYPGEVTTVIEALAASAASFIAVGVGGPVIIRPNAELMIHKAWTFFDGNADEMDRAKADLARQDVKIAQIYAGRAGGELDDWLGRMSEETWYTAEEAVEAGLVDAIEDAKQTAAAALGTRRVFAQFKYSNRAAAPPPPVGSRSESAPEKTQPPSNGQKGDTLSIQSLAQELGVKPDVLREKLSGFFNEAVSVSGEVEVTYPAETLIAPTETVTVEPVVGEPAAGGDEEPAGEPAPQNKVMAAEAVGLTFTLGQVPDGWEASVDESTGVLTVTAPASVEVDDTVEVTVTVNGDTDVPVTFKVKSLSDTSTGEPAGDPDAPVNDVVTVPRAVYDEWMADRKQYAALIEERKQKALEDKVDAHIRDGRYSAAHRQAAIAAYKADPVQAEKVWGGLPKNQIPVKELGNSGRAQVELNLRKKEDGHGPKTVEEQVALGASRRNKGAK